MQFQFYEVQDTAENFSIALIDKSAQKQKKSKNLKVAGNHPNIYFTQYLKNFTWKIKIINFYYSNYRVS
jgi:hypothetical protein